MAGIWQLLPYRDGGFMWWRKESHDKYATISWSIDGKYGYSVTIHYNHCGCGLHHWPNLRKLSDAETLVDILMNMDLETARNYINETHGKEITFE